MLEILVCEDKSATEELYVSLGIEYKEGYLAIRSLSVNELLCGHVLIYIIADCISHYLKACRALSIGIISVCAETVCILMLASCARFVHCQNVQLIHRLCCALLIFVLR